MRSSTANSTTTSPPRHCSSIGTSYLPASRIAELIGYDPLLASGVSTLMAARVGQRIVTYSAHTANPHRRRSDPAV